MDSEVVTGAWSLYLELLDKYLLRMVPNDNMNTTAKWYACTDTALGKED